ncbi:orange carotenoid protein N-terminal domain-containing protein [Sodalinema gerasimenkoae]|uniref:Orange carotenoid protein n=1 Tax=Coleofasciculus chthonoplastes B353 TaxID=2704251 RepID=A0A6B9W0H9_9CYAN|nr:orange carotenoid protein N-terminal domain-containing protein [Sodalinema gerasimenkoae]QHQ74407.1 orange carotenoid protein [Coleofasciculus chthonoplastes B353]
MAYATSSKFTTTQANALSTVEPTSLVPEVSARIQRLATDDQLALLWFIYLEMGKSITPAAPGAARLQLAEGLLAQVKALDSEEQMSFMRDLIAKRDTPLSRAYGVFNANTKLGFWYCLAQGMDEGTIIRVPRRYKPSRTVKEILTILTTQANFSQQITILRNAVVNMGFDALS